MGDVYPKAKIAATAIAPIYWDRDATTEKAIKYILEAGENGANIIGFGEAFIPGYPWWIWFGSPSWGQKFYGEFHKNSVEIPSPTTDCLCDAAKKAKIYAVIGMSEKKGGTLYCSQLYISPQGEIIGIHRKLKPSRAERSIWGDGGYIQVLDTEFGKLGGLNCNEHLMPLTRYAMYYLGEQIHIASWPAFSMKIGYATTAPPATYTTRHMAIEGCLFILMCTCPITKEVLEKICDTPEKAEMVNVGGAWTEIIAPDGQTIANQITEDKEGITYADIDLESIIYMKNRCDVIGHYSRPDLLQLSFNKETPTSVREFSLGMVPAAHNQLSSLFSNYKGLKQQIEKSDDQELFEIASKFEQEFKIFMEGSKIV